MAYDAARNELLVAGAVGVDGVSKSRLWAYDGNGALAWDVSAGPEIDQNSVTYATASGRDGSVIAWLSQKSTDAPDHVSPTLSGIPAVRAAASRQSTLDWAL